MIIVFTCILNYVYKQYKYVYMLDNNVYMQEIVYACIRNYVYIYIWVCIHIYFIMYTCKIIVYTCKICMYTYILNYVYMQDNYVYMQDNHVYIITY